MKIRRDLGGPSRKFWADSHETGPMLFDITHWPKQDHQMASLAHSSKNGPRGPPEASDGPLAVCGLCGTVGVCTTICMVKTCDAAHEA